MRLCVKIGGAALEEGAARARLAAAVAAARRAGHDVVVVHGGGNQIRALTRRLGFEDRYHDGLRITDDATADVALMVLAGQVNKLLVSELASAGVPAVGLCGADGGLFSVRRHAPDGLDLGWVGTVRDVRPDLVERLLGAGFVPVVATLAPLDPHEAGPRERLYNVNADQAAAPLARAFRCDALVFLTDVEGVRGADGARIAELDRGTCTALRQEGVIRGGMIPKVTAALDAADALPSALVKIAPADTDDAVLAALSTTTGTRFVTACNG